MFTLNSLGWGPFYAEQLTVPEAEAFVPARVAEEQRDRYRVLTPTGESAAVTAGRLRHELQNEAGALAPCVGDWVLIRPEAQGPAVIQRVLRRRTQFTRRAPGRRSAAQVVAANADTVFVVQSLNRDLNLRRLERYLALLWESGARPVILLSKADLSGNPESEAATVRSVAPGVSVHITSVMTEGGVEVLRPYLGEGQTVALVGSSGVGKSSLLNRLLGQEVMAVKGIREDDRGRHTTTFRRLALIPGGGVLMDTPGMRTVLLDDETGVSGLFGDIEELAAHCRFANCRHEDEPGCAVAAALAEGRLDAGRLRSHRKLVREEQYEARRHDRGLQLAEARRWRNIHRAYRARPDKRSL